jgi:sulfur carrier protein
MITVRLEPEGRELQFTKVNTVLQLLHKLSISQVSALIIRDGELLTPDRRLESGDIIIVRRVSSRG